MKRQIQKEGVRKWYGDDFLDLQNELYKAIDALLIRNNNVVLSGFEATYNSQTEDYSISPGIAYIDKDICFFEGAEHVTLPVYFTKEIIEADEKRYADGNDKPTEVHYKAVMNATSQGNNEIFLEDEGQPYQILLPFLSYDVNGDLHGVPKSDFGGVSSNVLATQKAIKNARRYLKENYSDGEINEDDIPEGETWIARNADVKIKEHVINVHHKPIHATNLPKILMKVKSDGSHTANLGSLYDDTITITNPSGGYYELVFSSIANFNNPDIIVEATIEGFKTITSGVGQDDNTLVIETKEWNGSDMVDANSDFNLAIYYAN